MKKLITFFVAIVLLSVVLISWKRAGGGAVVINDLGCIVLDGNGNAVFTDASHAVITPSGNGALSCTAQVENTRRRAVVFSDLNCNTPDGFITDGHETVSASGRAQLICHVNGN